MTKITILIIAVIASSVRTIDHELVSAIVLFRPGDRTPLQSYEKDLYKYAYYPLDFGQLTKLGKRQQYELGQWLRMKYNGFLSKYYSNKETYIRSIDQDITLMSAELVLEGLYYPQGYQLWNSKIKWQPIPVHTVPQKDDNLLAQQKSCPRYDLISAVVNETISFDLLRTVDQEIIDYLSNNTGEAITSFFQLYRLYDTLNTQGLHNLPLPGWVKKVYPDPLKEYANLYLIQATYTTEQARLKNGRLFYEIIDHFDKILNGLNIPKFVMYSVQGRVLINMLNSLGAYDGEIPPYSSAIIFELRKNFKNNSVVILYKKQNETSEINLKEYSKQSLEQLKTALHPLLVDERSWEAECKKL